MRCRLILLISDHPIQRAIRKEGGYPERDGGEGQVWWNSRKLDVIRPEALETYLGPKCTGFEGRVDPSCSVFKSSKYQLTFLVWN